MRRRTQLTACGVALLALSLGACSDDSSDPTTSPSGSSTAPSGSPSESEGASESAEPSVAPASGGAIDTDAATLNAPEGWKITDSGLPNTYGASNYKMAGTQLLTVIDLGGDMTDYTLDQRAQDAMTGLPGAKLSQQPDVELDGEPAYHVSGTVPDRGPYEEVGAGHNGRSVSIGIYLDGYSKAERREIVDSVIASFRWKE